MTKKEYNGWFNYETWLANLWITNEQSSSEFWEERARFAYDVAEDCARFSREENAALTLADHLKEYYDDNMHEMGVPELKGLYADLLNAALSEINWHEIAVHFIEDVKKEDA